MAEKNETISNLAQNNAGAEAQFGKKVSMSIILFILTNPKSKSKVQVQVRADDWVFIKIRFSNHPQQPGKVSKKQDRAILPK